jgi:type II secretory pathway pseudopilin PulG
MRSRRRQAIAMMMHRNSNGVTLIEMVVMLALLGAVIGGIYEFVVWAAKSAGVTNNFMQSQGQVRAALDNIADESRWATTVTAASATSVTLTVPVSTPFSATSPYTVTFAYDPTNRVVTRQQDAQAAEALAYLVVGSGGSSGLAFTYFDGGNNSLGSTPTAAQLPTIARVRAVVATTSGNVTRNLAGDAALRAHCEGLPSCP